MDETGVEPAHRPQNLDKFFHRPLHGLHHAQLGLSLELLEALQWVLLRGAGSIKHKLSLAAGRNIWTGGLLHLRGVPEHQTRH